METGANFESLALSRSADNTGRRGGLLGTFAPGTFAPELEAAVASVPIGELAPIAQSRWGYHIARRLPLDEVVVQHLTYAWRGARNASATRTREDALALAQQAQGQLRTGISASAIQADARSAAGGDTLGRHQWSELLEQAAFSMEPGDVSEPLETPLGWVVLKRER